MNVEESESHPVPKKPYASRVKDAQPEFLEAMGKLGEGSRGMTEDTKKFIEKEVLALEGDRKGERAIWRAEKAALLAGATSIFSGEPVVYGREMNTEAVFVLATATGIEGMRRALETKTDLTAEETRLKACVGAVYHACDRHEVEPLSVLQSLTDENIVPRDPQEPVLEGLGARIDLLRSGGELAAAGADIEAKASKIAAEVMAMTSAATGRGSETATARKPPHPLGRGEGVCLSPKAGGANVEK